MRRRSLALYPGAVCIDWCKASWLDGKCTLQEEVDPAYEPSQDEIVEFLDFFQLDMEALPLVEHVLIEGECGWRGIALCQTDS